MQTAAEIRTQFRALRRSLPAKIVQETGSVLARNLIATPIFQFSRSIAAYLANDGEARTEELISEIWRQGKTCYLPILRTEPTRCLWFGPYRPDSALAQNRFRIPEPAIDAETLRDPVALDLALVPLVAFDGFGNRIGMGGGYYDRTFAYRNQAGFAKKPILIDIGFECQKLSQLPTQPWDVSLDGVVTERACYRFSEAAGGS